MKLRLLGLLFAAAFLAGCESRVEMAPRRAEPAPTRTPEVAPPAARLIQTEREILNGVNAQRTRNGLEPLASDSELTRLAREYSRRMAREDFFSHTAPNGDTLIDRVKEADFRYSLIGENLFKSVNVPTARFPKVAVQGWLDSPGHRKNMLRDGFTETGVGVWKDGDTLYATQLFSHPR